MTTNSLVPSVRKRALCALLLCSCGGGSGGTKVTADAAVTANPDAGGGMPLSDAGTKPVDAQSAVADARPNSDTGSGTCAVPAGVTWWKPRAGVTWDWQLLAPVDPAVKVDVIDVDLFDASAATIKSLHDAGKKVICYVNVGAWEDWRSDAADFPDVLKGNKWSQDSFTNERWLNIKRIDLLGPLLGKRFDLGKSKGCDALEPDNVDGYDNGGSNADKTGFKLTANDQLTFNQWLTCEAHARGMAVGLKNDPEQAATLATSFDFALTEQCFQYGECEQYSAFTKAGKPILDAEYVEELAGLQPPKKFTDYCADAKRLQISAILKTEALDAKTRQACP